MRKETGYCLLDKQNYNKLCIAQRVEPTELAYYRKLLCERNCVTKAKSVQIYCRKANIDNVIKALFIVWISTQNDLSAQKQDYHDWLKILMKTPIKGLSKALQHNISKRLQLMTIRLNKYSPTTTQILQDKCLLIILNIFKHDK